MDPQYSQKPDDEAPVIASPPTKKNPIAPFIIFGVGMLMVVGLLITVIWVFTTKQKVTTNSAASISKELDYGWDIPSMVNEHNWHLDYVSDNNSYWHLKSDTRCLLATEQYIVSEMAGSIGIVEDTLNEIVSGAEGDMVWSGITTDEALPSSTNSDEAVLFATTTWRRVSTNMSMKLYVFSSNYSVLELRISCPTDTYESATSTYIDPFIRTFGVKTKLQSTGPRL